MQNDALMGSGRLKQEPEINSDALGGYSATSRELPLLVDKLLGKCEVTEFEFSCFSKSMTKIL